MVCRLTSTSSPNGQLEKDEIAVEVVVGEIVFVLVELSVAVVIAFYEKKNLKKSKKRNNHDYNILLVVVGVAVLLEVLLVEVDVVVVIVDASIRFEVVFNKINI
jgi:hypothetical protein